MRTRAILLAFALAATGAEAEERTIAVDTAGSLGALNEDLHGTTQGSANQGVIDRLAAIRQRHIRIDTWFEQGVYDCASAPDFTALDDRVESVRATGAEPLVIIDYMPPCLSRYTGPTFGNPPQPDPSRHPPSDYDAWEVLVQTTIHHLATTPGLDVRWFEAWNEPNLPQFFQGTIADYLSIFDRIEKALGDVRAETGLDLRLGGPAIAFPDPVWLSTFLAHVVANHRRLDFVSWHWYASYPLFGPLVGEPPFSIPPANVENPATKPRDYADHTAFVRSLVDAAWAARSDAAPKPFLWIDEWNLNAGRDARHDSSEAAAFAAAALDHMLRAGLDRASFFNVEDAADLNFNQGMFFFHRGTPPDGTPKPVYATFRFFSRMRGERLPVAVGPLFDADAEGIASLALQQDNLGAIAARDATGGITVLVYNWSPRLDRPETVTLAFPGPVTGTLEILPAGADDGDDVTPPAAVAGQTITFPLDDSSLAFLAVEEP